MRLLLFFKNAKIHPSSLSTCTSQSLTYWKQNLSEVNQEWFKRLFATDVAIARGGWSWGVSPSKPSRDSIPIRQNSISISEPCERPGPVDVGQAGVDGEQDEQEEGEEVAEDVHPELCWQGKGQLWTVGRAGMCCLNRLWLLAPISWDHACV